MAAIVVMLTPYFFPNRSGVALGSSFDSRLISLTFSEVSFFLGLLLRFTEISDLSKANTRIQVADCTA